MKASGSTAVMERRAGKDQAHEIPELELWRELDLFPTPPWATRALFHHVMPAVPGLRPLPSPRIWEPAAGLGHMSAVLEEFGRVYASDVHPFAGLHDFIDFRAPAPNEVTFFDGGPGVDWIVTNPPFMHGLQFVERALEQAQVGVAFLCRLAWLETVGRYHNLWLKTPPTLVCPFVERVPMCLGGWDPKLSSATAYAWFVWLRGPHSGEWRAKGDGRLDVWLIPPGCREGLTRERDRELAARFVEGWIPPSTRKRAKNQLSLMEGV